MYRTLLLSFLLSTIWGVHAQVPAADEISILYIKQLIDRPPVLANLDAVPEDEGTAGARLAIQDNNATGRFLKQQFTVQEVLFNASESADTILKAVQESKHHFVILNLPALSLESVIKADVGNDKLLFNVGSADDRFRIELCRNNLLHSVPSRAMLGDALTQYLIKKRWIDWMLVQGPLEGDKKFADAMRRSAAKFGAKILTEKIWDGGRDARRSAQSEVPLLTQGKDYDVLIVADEWGDFGDYLMYRTWTPRPVAGTQSLFPTGWYWTAEQWGATQLQTRFYKLAKRRLGDKDFAAWVAVRSIGEAATRLNSTESKKIIDYIQSPKFELAAYKGRKLSYRPWSGQLRQPIVVTTPKSLVTNSPQEGFLHQRNELDTLGFDEPEVHCKRN
ncbi:MAG: branched-chain amino acid ABC transporter substrate-binding protein [Sedimenticola thiotaurini]|uniref:Branched-chain amino acid ABC transporter substrate-binding protein n=1 Tax=Sedimenticola thiotaurini TaxID=1543721 RepID=A0A558CXM1_9GAMM|nr:MAG: branched-chain amino acid ABC transporter substrate-binding protein [Sedimenticola thiotaurini]